MGVGITAGCIATLRPLLQLILTKMGRGTISRSNTPGSNSRHMARRGLQLDGLKPSHGNITTITGNDTSGSGLWPTRDSSQEELAAEHIRKQVRVEFAEADSISPPQSRFDD